MEEKNIKRVSPGEILKSALKITLPVMAGYVFLGIAFGLLMRTGGYPFWYPVLMSLIIYSGALEYAAVPLAAQALNPVGTFVFGLMISIRHLFYGIPMLKKYKNAGPAKPFLIFGLTDETFSILSVPGAGEEFGEEARTYYLAVTLLDYMYWNIGTAIGAAVGDILPFSLEGLDFALTALFVVLFTEQISSRSGLISGIAGLTATVVSLIFAGKDRMVAVAMVLILVLIFALKGVIGKQEGSEEK